MANHHATGGSPANVPGFTSLPQLAVELGVSNSLIYNRVSKNLIPTVRICGSGPRLIPNRMVELIKRGVDVRDMDPTAEVLYEQAS